MRFLILVKYGAWIFTKSNTRENYRKQANLSAIQAVCIAFGSCNELLCLLIHYPNSNFAWITILIH